MKQLGFYIDHLIKPSLCKKGFYQTKIFSDWHLIVGDNISLYSMPVKMTLPKSIDDGKGMLSIEVASSSIATELHYLEPLIIEKIAVYFGYKAIAKIKLIVNPEIKKASFNNKPGSKKNLTSLQQEKLDNLTNAVEDEALRQALLGLAQEVIVNSH